MSTAVQAGLALHAIETAAGLTYGTASALAWLAALGPVRGAARGWRALRTAVLPATRIQPEVGGP